jgi:predicted metal-dependent HD superfamily phosphohydrolase
MTKPTLPARPAHLPLPPAALEALKQSYGSPGRHYHTWEHVLEVLGYYEKVARDVGWAHPREVYLAVLFHDAVYDIGAKDNEARSADMAGEAIETWWPTEALEGDLVRDLINLTARHGRIEANEVTDESALFVDCDMAILGSELSRYARYEDQIFGEYGAIYPEKAYRMGRSTFLAELLARDTIFLSPYFREKYEDRARRNIASALTGLQD